jgi:tetratricopeptide (TPR) repeat protein
VKDIEKIKSLDSSVITYLPDAQRANVSLHENLGVTLEEAGDLEEALKYFRLAAEAPNGSTASYRAAALLSRRANTAWEERRPSEALRDFMDARDFAVRDGPLPPKVTSLDRERLLTGLDQMIKFLQEAKIAPAERSR